MRDLAVTAVALVLLTACGANGVPTGDPPTTEDTGSSNSTDPTRPIGYPDDPGEVVLQVTVGPGGFAESPADDLRLPTWRLYGDRTLLWPETAVTAEARAYGQLQVRSRRLTEEQVQDLLEQAADAGLPGDEDRDYGDPGITDQGTTVVRAHTDEGEAVVGVYALSRRDDAHGDLTDDQVAARQKLIELIDALGRLSDQGSPYRAERWLVTGRMLDPDEIEDPSDPMPAWTLEDPATSEKVGPGQRCVVVAAAELEAVVSAADMPAENIEAWKTPSGPQELRFRPLLPGESDCDALR